MKQRKESRSFVIRFRFVPYQTVQEIKDVQFDTCQFFFTESRLGEDFYNQRSFDVQRVDFELIGSDGGVFVSFGG